MKNEPVTMTVQIGNKSVVGQAGGVYPGLGIALLAPTQRLGEREEDKFEEFHSQWVPYAETQAGQDVGAGQNVIIDYSTPFKLTKVSAPALSHGEIYLYFFGAIKWTDGDGTWETQWCDHLLVDRSDLRTGNAIWKECESGVRHNFTRHPFVPK